VKTLTFSLCYPHNQRPLLAKEGILPLVDQPNVYRFNYFLSLYKGENITIQLSVKDDAELKNLLEEHFEHFYEQHHVPLKELILPIDQMFLDFPYNTLHIWQQSPFRPGMFVNQEVTIDYYQNMLSRKCLGILASQDEWDESVSFGVFIELLFCMSSYLTYHGQNVNKFLSGLLNILELKVQVNKELIPKYRKQGVGIYQQNASDIHDYYRKISAQIESYKDEQDAGDWLRIFELKAGKQDWQKGNCLTTKLCEEFVFDVSQKIDLDQNGLVRAWAVVFETIKSLL
jgi:hypothetical protein